MIYNLLLAILLWVTIPVMSQNFNHINVCVQQACFLSRIADNPVTRSRGLMHETRLPKAEGLLFVFPYPGMPGFWMKNMKFPIDILYVNEQDIVAYIVKNAQPCSGAKTECPIYKPTHKTIRVLEINAGLSEEYNIHVGDAVQYFIEE
jgi:uncharacterized protein